jgi:hypothetical protein
MKSKLIVGGAASALVVVAMLTQIGSIHAGVIYGPGFIYFPTTPLTATPTVLDNVVYFPPAAPTSPPAPVAPTAAQTAGSYSSGWNTGVGWRFCTVQGEGLVWLPSGAAIPAGALC